MSRIPNTEKQASRPRKSVWATFFLSKLVYIPNPPCVTGAAEPGHDACPAGVSLPPDEQELLPPDGRLPQPPRHLRLCLLPPPLPQVYSPTHPGLIALVPAMRQGC
jgi:hypothetical protein